MIRPTTHFTFLFLVLLIFSFIGCAGGYYGKLRSTNQISGKELRQNWNDYTVYYQPYYALLYKINNDRKIVLSSRWVEVANAEIVKNSTAFYLEDVREILGQNDELYGYLVYPSRDTAHINLIDEKTVEVIYSRRIVRGE